MRFLESFVIMKYFKEQEFIKSTTAKKNKIDNTPSSEILSHIRELMEFLDPIREKWGRPIYITSGYRCEALNTLVKGVKTSNHLTGYAADMKTENVSKFYYWLVRYVLDNHIKFDELFLETKGASQWVHFALKNKFGKQRLKTGLLFP